MRFVVEPRLLDHFGVAMYNTLEKAIAELVANGYDAGAAEVKITLDEDAIVVADDGRGMTPTEVEHNYLHLGRDRRASDGRETTPKRKRAIIGHKGIGKLAGLGHCRDDDCRDSPGGQASSPTTSSSRPRGVPTSFATTTPDFVLVVPRSCWLSSSSARA